MDNQSEYGALCEFIIVKTKTVVSEKQWYIPYISEFSFWVLPKEDIIWAGLHPTRKNNVWKKRSEFLQNQGKENQYPVWSKPFIIQPVPEYQLRFLSTHTKLSS